MGCSGAKDATGTEHQPVEATEERPEAEGDAKGQAAAMVQLAIKHEVSFLMAGVTTRYFLDNGALFKQIGYGAPQPIMELDLAICPKAQRQNLKELADFVREKQEAKSVETLPRFLAQGPSGQRVAERSTGESKASHNLSRQMPRQSALGVGVPEGLSGDSKSSHDRFQRTHTRDLCGVSVLQLESCKPLRLAFDIQKRFNTLEKLDAYIVQHWKYKDAVTNVISSMVEHKLTLNHVSCVQAVKDLNENGSLRPPALGSMPGRLVSDLDKDDICKGLGYYHFNRISAGTMRIGPNFTLTNQSRVMFFIDPRVLFQHHFIACKGNAAHESAEKCPGKLQTTMTNEDALTEALRAVTKLDEMIQRGVNNVPYNNEVAVFHGIESSFVYPHMAVLEGSTLLSMVSPFAERAFFKVRPTTRRYEAGVEAISRGLSIAS